jgi:hypothetical protein
MPGWCSGSSSALRPTRTALLDVNLREMACRLRDPDRLARRAARTSRPAPRPSPRLRRARIVGRA